MVELEELARLISGARAKIAVPACPRSLSEDLRQDPAVLEIVVALRWLLGVIGEGSLSGEPGDERSIAGDRRCRPCLALAG